MGTDYHNPKTKKKAPSSEEVPDKNVQKVVKSEVIRQKRPLRKRIKDIFISGDSKSVASYLLSNVILPSAKNIIVDAANEGIKRMIYGDGPNSRSSYPNSTRYSYNRPVDRSYRDPRDRGVTLSSNRSPNATRFKENEPFLLTNQEEANIVLERMQDIINIYEVVSVADLNELVGFPQSPVDQTWGWENITGSHVRQTREGYLIELPPAIPI